MLSKQAFFLQKCKRATPEATLLLQKCKCFIFNNWLYCSFSQKSTF